MRREEGPEPNSDLSRCTRSPRGAKNNCVYTFPEPGLLPLPVFRDSTTLHAPQCTPSAQAGAGVPWLCCLGSLQREGGAER